MIVCPVCEHPQAQGAECEVCGKRLAQGAAAAAAPVPLVEGLEPTGLAPVDVPDDHVAELEPTGLPPAIGVAEERTPDMEMTRIAPVDVDVTPMADVERIDAAIPGDAPTPVAATPICRYCRTPSAPGERLCSRCGMRLALPPSSRPAEAAPAGRICSCGMMVTGPLCPSCGARR